MAQLKAFHVVWLVSAILGLSGGVTAEAANPPFQRADIAVRNVHVVDTRSGEVLPGRTLWIRDDRIAAITEGDQAHESRIEVDGQGSYAIPGLWDAHVHLIGNDADAALRVAPVWLSFGVTHLRDMGSSTAALQAFKGAFPSPDRPHVLASGPAIWAFELPYGDKSQQRVVGEEADVRSAVREAAVAGADFIKVYAGFPPEKLATLIETAGREGLRVAGHAQPGAPLDVQAGLGLQTIEHLETSSFEGCGVDPDTYFERVIAARFGQSGETIPAVLSDFVSALDREACLAILRRAASAGLVMTPTLTASFLPPTLAQSLAPALEPQQREACSMYLAGFGDAVDRGDATYAAARDALMALVRDAGMPILAGTDTPAFCGSPGASLALELRLLGQSGLSPLEVLQSATLTPAKVFGFGDRFGTIETGMQADIVLLPANPLLDLSAYENPIGLIQGGLWRDRSDLLRLRASHPEP